MRRLLNNIPHRFFSELTHVDSHGKARIVNISNKTPTIRRATASTNIYLPDGIVELIEQNNIKKGDVIGVARVAGIQAAKQCSSLIPLCHPIKITSVDLDFVMHDKYMYITSTVEAYDTTGVEMEAIMSSNVAAMTVYDLCKAVSKRMVIFDVKLLSKSGGKSGDYQFK